MIRVADENDNAPKFIGNGKPIVAVIPNTANFGYPVTTVQTIDEDIGINAEIRYMLLNEPSKLFEIDEISGSIRVLGPMSGADQRVYGFDVKATDRRGAEDGKSTITNVFVSIILVHVPMNALSYFKRNIFESYYICRCTFWMINDKCVWCCPAHL